MEKEAKFPKGARVIFRSIAGSKRDGEYVTVERSEQRRKGVIYFVRFNDGHVMDVRENELFSIQ